MRVELESYALEVEDHGDGIAVMLVHGFPLSSEIFAPVRPAIEQAARLVTPDLRGFGYSDTPQGDYSMDALAEDVVAVADVLGLDRFVVGGHSMGGYVALRVAERHRDRLAGLILIDTRAGADSMAAAARRDDAVAAIREHGKDAFLASFLPGLVGPSSQRKGGRYLADLQGIAASIPEHVLAGCLRGMRDRPDGAGMLAGLDVPALVVVGAEDTVTPPDEARAMAAALPRARLAVIPEAGHTPTMERPIPTGDAIVAFLREQLGTE